MEPERRTIVPEMEPERRTIVPEKKILHASPI
jgi:hypothetical protein